MEEEEKKEEEGALGASVRVRAGAGVPCWGHQDSAKMGAVRYSLGCPRA